MLTVYTYLETCPSDALDLSAIPLDELVQAVSDIYRHQTITKIWFGYLEGWMLSPCEEVRVRQVLRKFDCGLVTHFPLSLSRSWQNEIDTIYTAKQHGATNINDNGGALQHGCSSGHGQTSERPSLDERNHQDRKTGSAAKRRVKARQDKTPENESNTTKDHRIWS